MTGRQRHWKPWRSARFPARVGRGIRRGRRGGRLAPDRHVNVERADPCSRTGRRPADGQKFYLMGGLAWVVSWDFGPRREGPTARSRPESPPSSRPVHRVRPPRWSAVPTAASRARWRAVGPDWRRPWGWPRLSYGTWPGALPRPRRSAGRASPGATAGRAEPQAGVLKEVAHGVGRCRGTARVVPAWTFVDPSSGRLEGMCLGVAPGRLQARICGDEAVWPTYLTRSRSLAQPMLGVRLGLVGAP